MSRRADRWWKNAVIYQIYPRSFCDTDGDGVGDLEGIRRHLDHLEWLGVDAIWLSPFFVSPMADYGYDVADFCDVDPLFGKLEGFDRLLAEAHERSLRVVIDWVPNHSSDQHPWFQESRQSRESPKRDWYYWRDGASPGRPPNNWRDMFLGGPSWTWDPGTRQWYLHTFLPQQPDLNWGNPEVVSAMHDTLRFWLDRGVDGFRVDVAHLIGKDPALPDWVPGEPAHEPMPTWSTHSLLKGLRQLVDSYDGDRMMVGEIYIMSTAKVATFYGELTSDGSGERDELHLAFNFPPLYAPWEAPAWHHRITRVAEELEPRDAWPTWVLSNHDNPRHRTRYGSEARARAAALLLLTLRGTPFVYAGEELGLEDAVVPPDRMRDPGGRDGCRAPVPWTADVGHGWSGDPWLPWPPWPELSNVEVEQADPGSMAHLYRRLLATRRGSPALSAGSLELLDGLCPLPEGVVGYRRVADGSGAVGGSEGGSEGGGGGSRGGADMRVVLVNFTGELVEVPLGGVIIGDLTVEVSSDGLGEGDRYTGRLGPDQAILLHPTGDADAVAR